MREYLITRQAFPVSWEQVPVLSIDNLQWTDSVDIRAEGQLCWDDQALYVRLSAEEKNIRAVENNPLGYPCKDSCLEFFIRPDENDVRYFNFEFNPNCCMYLGLGGEKQSQLIRLLPETTCFDPSAEYTDKGWRITYRIPFSFICHFFPDFVPASGKVIRANCYKCGDLTEKEHYLSWNPIDNKTPRFHKPDDFGRMIFA